MRFSNVFAYPSSTARSPWKDEEKTSQRHPQNGFVAAGYLIKEFSTACGTRSFLGDDVLKFTVGVRSFLPMAYLARTSSTVSARYGSEMF